MSQTIEDICDTYVGVRWIPGGNSLQGVDCIGLVAAVAFDLGLYSRDEIEVPRYSQLPNGGQMLKMLSQYLKRIPQPQLGCVATFSQPGTSLYHVGILGDKHFYHAALDHKKVVKVGISENALKGRRACFLFERPDGISEATPSTGAVEGVVDGGIVS